MRNHEQWRIRPIIVPEHRKPTTAQTVVGILCLVGIVGMVIYAIYEAVIS